MRQRISLAVAGGLVATGLATAPADAGEPVFRLEAPATLALPAHPATGDPRPAALTFRLGAPETGTPEFGISEFGTTGSGATGVETWGGVEGLGFGAAGFGAAGVESGATGAESGGDAGDGSGGGSGGAFAGEFTFTVELAGLAGLATVREARVRGDGAAPAGSCVPSGTTLVCTDRGPAAGRGADLELIAEPGAVPGATGDVTVTGAVAGATIEAATTTVRVGGPDLLVAELDLRRDPKPGESQPLPLAFTNLGTEPARGAVLELEVTRGMEFEERFDNCSYRDTRATTRALCSLDGEFEAGATYELAAAGPPRLRAGAHAAAELLGYGVRPADAPSGSRPPPLTGRPYGGDRTLLARRTWDAPTLPPTPPGAERRRAFDFAVPNTADLVADPLRLKGPAGAVVTAVAVVRNLGPARLADPRSAAPAAVVDVVVPQGVRVVGAPGACAPVAGAGSARYVCATGPVLPEAEEARFRFELRIEKVIPDALGSVTAGRRGPGGVSERHPLDPNPVNDTAAFTVNATGLAVATPGHGVGLPAPGGSGSVVLLPGGTDPGASASAHGRDGMPARGPAGNEAVALLIGSGGALLVAGGGALYLSTRRRRPAA
ncbi:hypothetical protein AB0P15_22990 [Streptomyces sp. NPDC087917]|uniref:hypothetical protein n=1 Tax=Streptomyces sp. NPDC087917 TaxID=3155060 RepID=UPI0034490CBF